MSGRPSWKSAEICRFRPFSAFFALFWGVRRALAKSRKRRKKAFSLGYPRICLNPHLLNPICGTPSFAYRIENDSGAILLCRRATLTNLEAPKPTQNPEIPKKHRTHKNFFKKFAQTLAFFPVTRVRNPTEIVQKTCSDERFYFGWILWVDFPPDRPDQTCFIIHVSRGNILF